MIEGWDPRVPNAYRIAVTNVQVGNALVNGYLEGEGRIELDSHANICVLGNNFYLLSKLSSG